MVRLRSPALALLVLGLAVPAAAQAPPPDLSGTWTLETTAVIVDTGTCTFTGQITIQQQGSALTGNAVQTLVDGHQVCPPMMMATLGGEVDVEGCVTMGTMMGPLGEASFTGCGGEDPDSLEGQFFVGSGPFQGTAGSWLAVLQPQSVLEIPALSSLGLAALAVLLLAFGAWLLRRRAVV